jgi:phospholipid/cholesterol/gamma-HCH transport system permease protein
MTLLPLRWGRSSIAWLLAWWRMFFVGAQVLSLLLSPASFSHPLRRAMARHVVDGVWTTLPWFAVVSTLISLILTRIVVVTARGYGLSQYALEMVVRVLVLELIPITAALFVALRYTIPLASELLARQRAGRFEAVRAQGLDPLRAELLPRLVGGLFASLLLAAVSGAVCLVLAYLVVYGFSPWGFGTYTRVFGQVFSPVVTMIFVFKAIGFSLAVAWIPLSAAVDAAAPHRARHQLALQGLIRMFSVILVIEIVSLLGNYA